MIKPLPFLIATGFMLVFMSACEDNISNQGSSATCEGCHTQKDRLQLLATAEVDPPGGGG